MTITIDRAHNKKYDRARADARRLAFTAGGVAIICVVVAVLAAPSWVVTGIAAVLALAALALTITLLKTSANPAYLFAQGTPTAAMIAEVGNRSVTIVGYGQSYNGTEMMIARVCQNIPGTKQEVGQIVPAVVVTDRTFATLLPLAWANADYEAHRQLLGELSAAQLDRLNYAASQVQAIKQARYNMLPAPAEKA